MIYVVSGPPCAGKSTYVSENAAAGDVRIDFDVIAKAFGSDDSHDAPEDIREVAFRARSGAISKVLEGVGVDAWVIHTKIPDGLADAYTAAGAEVVVVDPGKAVCLERAAADGRPERSIAAIEEWYAENPGADEGKSGGAMRVKSIPLDVKAGGDSEGSFTAYASVFGVKDSYGDVVEPGAFKHTLELWEAKGRPIPLLFGHNNKDPDYFIGSVTKASEDAKGLLVECQIDTSTAKGATVYKLVKDGLLAEMSFMYRVTDGDFITPVVDGKSDWRNEYYSIKGVDLYEVSVVHVGANPDTSIMDVKSAADEARKSGRVPAGQGAECASGHECCEAKQGDSGEAAEPAVTKASAMVELMKLGGN